MLLGIGPHRPPQHPAPRPPRERPLNRKIKNFEPQTTSLSVAISSSDRHLMGSITNR